MKDIIRYRKTRGKNDAHDLDEVLRDDLVEACEESLDLLLDRRVQSVLGRELHKLALVFLGNRKRRAVLLQFNELRDAEL